MTALVALVLLIFAVAGVLLAGLRHPIHHRQETTMPETQQAPPPRAALADLHAYVVPVSPKMLRETLCVAQAGLAELERQTPGYNAGGTIATHIRRLHLLVEEIDRMRPLGPGGKHDERHTPVCGCKP
jgi:hypothetical protein